MCKVNQHCGNKRLCLEKVKPVLAKYVLEEPHVVISLASSKNGKGQHSVLSGTCS